VYIHNEVKLHFTTHTSLQIHCILDLRILYEHNNHIHITNAHKIYLKIYLLLLRFIKLLLQLSALLFFQFIYTNGDLNKYVIFLRSLELNTVGIRLLFDGPLNLQTNKC